MKMRGLLVLALLLLFAGGASAQNQLGKTLMSCEILHITKRDTLLGDYTIYDYDSIGRITDLRRYNEMGEMYDHLKYFYCGCIQDTYEKTQTGEWEMRDRVEYLDSTYEYDQYSAFFYKNRKKIYGCFDSLVCLSVMEYDSLGRVISCIDFDESNGDTSSFSKTVYKRRKSMTYSNSVLWGQTVSIDRHRGRRKIIVTGKNGNLGKTREVYTFDRQGRQVSYKKYYKGKLDSCLEYEYHDNYWITYNRLYGYRSMHFTNLQ